MKTGEQVKQFRKMHGLSLARLAAMGGVTKGYLSKIERSKNPPPFSTLQKLAEALNVDVNDLLVAGERDGNSRNIDFISGASKNRLAFKTEGVCAFKLLLKNYRKKQMSPFLMTIAKGKTRRFKHDAEEFVYIVSGRVELEYDGETYVFRENDSFYLDSRLGHAFRNRDEQDAVLLAVDFNYRRF